MACDGRATCGRLVKYWPEAENLSQAMTAVEAEAKARVEAEAEAMAAVEAEAEVEANAKGSGRGKCSRDFLNAF